MFVGFCMRRKLGKYPREIKHGSVAVKVYRVKHKTTASGFAYVVAYTGTDGIRRLPQFANEADALEEARLRAGQIAAGKAEAADMSRTDRDELVAAREIAGGPLLAALRDWKRIQELTDGHGIAAAEAWAARNNGKFESILVSDATDNFIAAKKRAGVDVASSYERIFPSLKEFAGTLALSSLSAPQIQSWLETRYPHPVTRNTARKRLVTLWRWARKQGYLPRDAMTEAEQTDSAREAINEIGIINVDTFSKLLHHVATQHPEYLAALTLAGFCGLRRSEIHGQEWTDVNLERKFVRVTNAKRNTPARRLVPLSDAAVQWLLLCNEREGALSSDLAVDRIRKIAREARDAAGKPVFPELPKNCFRHSFISHRVAQTGNVAETALEAGNSPQIIFRHYRELFTKEEGVAWFSAVPAATVQTPKSSAEA